MKVKILRSLSQFNRQVANLPVSFKVFAPLIFISIIAVWTLVFINMSGHKTPSSPKETLIPGLNETIITDQINGLANDDNGRVLAGFSENNPSPSPSVSPSSTSSPSPTPRSTYSPTPAPTSTPSPTATPLPTPTPTPIVSRVYIQALDYSGKIPQAIVGATVTIANSDSGDIISKGLTDGKGFSPDWYLPANTSFTVTLLPPKNSLGNYCNNKWSGNTGPNGTTFFHVLTLENNGIHPCLNS